MFAYLCACACNYEYNCSLHVIYIGTTYRLSENFTYKLAWVVNLEPALRNSIIYIRGPHTFSLSTQVVLENL